MDETQVQQNTPAPRRSFAERIRAALKRRPSAAEFAVVFVFFFGRFLAFGAKYYVQAGDYLSFGTNSVILSGGGDPAQYLGAADILSGGPLAGLADVYLWSRLFGSLTVVLFVFSLLYAASAVILRRVFERMFGTGYFFTAVFCLFPFTLDGVYVISNASHTVAAFFFCALSALCMQRVKETGKLRYVPAFSVAQLLTFGFDEKVAVLSAAVCAVIAFKNRNKYSLTALMIVANFSVYALFLQLGRLYWGDAETVRYALPFTDGYYSSVFLPALQKIGNAFSASLPGPLFRSVGRGFSVMFGEGGVIFFILLILCSAGLFLLLRKKSQALPCAREAAVTLLCGLLFAAAPVIPVFFAGSPEFTLADAAPVVCGVALMLDLALRAATRARSSICAPIITAAVVLFCAAGVSEIRDYRAVTEADLRSADEVVTAISESGVPDGVGQDASFAVLNLDVGPDGADGPVVEGHMVPAAADPGSFTAMLRTVSGDIRFPRVTAMPVDADGYFYTERDGNGKRIENFDVIFVAVDGEMIRVIPARGFTDGDYDPRANYENYLLYTVDFTRLAHVSEYATYGIFKFY